MSNESDFAETLGDLVESFYNEQLISAADRAIKQLLQIAENAASPDDIRVNAAKTILDYVLDINPAVTR